MISDKPQNILLCVIFFITSNVKSNFECLLVFRRQWSPLACWRLNIISDYDLLFFAHPAHVCLFKSNLPNCYFANYNPSKLDLHFLVLPIDLVWLFEYQHENLIKKRDWAVYLSWQSGIFASFCLQQQSIFKPVL